MNRGKHICPNCGSKNTGDTSPAHIDTMRDFFCYDCSMDFYDEETLKKLNSEIKKQQDFIKK